MRRGRQGTAQSRCGRGPLFPQRGRLGSPVCGRSGPVPPPETPPGSGGEAAPRVTRPTTHPRRIITRGGSAAASTAPAPACLCLPPLGGSPQPGVCRVKARIRFPASSIKISGKKSPAGERDGEREERGVSRRSVGKRSRGADNTRSTSSTRRTPGTPAARPLQLREKRFSPPEVSPRGRRGLPGAAGGSCLPNPLLRARCEALHPITPHPGVLPRTASSPLIPPPPPPPPGMTGRTWPEGQAGAEVRGFPGVVGCFGIPRGFVRSARDGDVSGRGSDKGGEGGGGEGT